MSEEIQGKRIAFLAADGVERVELVEPWKAVEEAGAEAVADLARGRRRSGRSTTSTSPTSSRSTRRSATPTPATSTGSCCRAASRTPTSLRTDGDA